MILGNNRLSRKDTGVNHFSTTICLAIFLILSFLSKGNAAETNEILVLHSYHQGLVWTDDIMKGIHSVFNTYDPQNEIHVEYMDTKKYFDGLNGKYLTRLHDIYKDKYSSKKPDIIISSDDNAFQFLLMHHDELFPGIPIVFCGVNNFEDTMIAGHDHVTGVIEFLDKKANIDIALKLHPDANEIAIITDTSETGKANRIMLEQLAGEYKDRAEFVFIDKDNTGLTLQELLDKLRRLPETSIVYYSDFLRNRDEYIVQETAVPQISATSRRPIYTHYDEILGLGVVGGKLVNGFSHGRKAAQMAYDILRGKPVSSLPVYKESINTLMFDYKQLKRFGIDKKDLHKGSAIINRPFSFYREYRQLVWAVLGVFSTLVISLITISINVIKRKKAEEKLKMAHDELEEKVKERTRELSKANADLHTEIRERINTQSMLKETQQKLEKAQAIARVGNWEWVILSNTVEWSNEVFRLYGLDPEKDRPHYDTVIKALSPESSDAFINAVEDSLKYDKPFEGEYSIILPDGTRKFIYVKGEVIRSAEGKPLIMFGIVQDISERKEMENQIMSTLKEKEILMREIHHRVKNNMTVISSMLSLHSRLIRNKQDRQIFDEAQARIKAMAIIHEKLYQSGDMSKINISDYIRDLLGEISSSYAVNRGRIVISTDIQDITQSIDDAIPFGLIVNELISNAMKHAFPESGEGEIKVKIALNGTGKVTLSVSDNGVGIPDDVDSRKSASLGLNLVDALVRQIRGELKLHKDNGTRFDITFPGRQS